MLAGQPQTLQKFVEATSLIIAARERGIESSLSGKPGKGLCVQWGDKFCHHDSYDNKRKIHTLTVHVQGIAESLFRNIFILAFLSKNGILISKNIP